MHQSEYRLIADHPLRHLLRSVCNDPRDLPTKSELREALVEALPQAKGDVIDALMTKCAAYAQKAVDPGARFDLRAAADALTLEIVKTYEAEDRLVPIVEETIDAKAIADTVTEPNEAEKILHSVTSRAVDSEQSWA